MTLLGAKIRFHRKNDPRNAQDNVAKTRICSACKQVLPFDAFYEVDHERGYHSSRCKACDTKYAKARRNAKGTQIPLEQAKDIGAYLGVYIVERLLGSVFKTTIRMPYGNPGYDFICGKGFKVDVKASCRHHKGKAADRWHFNIKKNKTADYFACFAMDSRQSLNPEHFWLFPSCVISNKHSLVIFEDHLDLWGAYEQPLDRVIQGCAVIRGVPA
jgi:uncharacterized CHY-type Zn-finger protein